MYQFDKSLYQKKQLQKKYNYKLIEMKDNIESKNIGNRKIIIELRFDHKVTLSDKKGTIIEKLKQLNLINPFYWEIGMANFTVYDNVKKNEARNFVIAELDKLSFISSKIDSIDNFYSKFEKIRGAFIAELGELNIRRIGCRIQGTYYTKSNSIDAIMDNIKKGFPSQFYLSNYPINDMMFRLTYKNGVYNIGPVNENNDAFLQQNFDGSYRKNHFGVAIDTDNYLTSENCPINELQTIKDVFVLSLSVERDLFSNMKDF